MLLYLILNKFKTRKYGWDIYFKHCHIEHFYNMNVSMNWKHINMLRYNHFYYKIKEDDKYYIDITNYMFYVVENNDWLYGTNKILLWYKEEDSYNIHITHIHFSHKNNNIVEKLKSISKQHYNNRFNHYNNYIKQYNYHYNKDDYNEYEKNLFECHKIVVNPIYLDGCTYLDGKPVTYSNTLEYYGYKISTIYLSYYIVAYYNKILFEIYNVLKITYKLPNEIIYYIYKKCNLINILNKIMREKLYNYRYLNSDTKFICKNTKQNPFSADYYYKDIFGNWNLLSEDSKMTHSGKFAHKINFNLFDNIPIGQMTKTLQKNYNFV